MRFTLRCVGGKLGHMGITVVNLESFQPQEKRARLDKESLFHTMCSFFGVKNSVDQLLEVLDYVRMLFTYVIPTEDDSADLIDQISANIRRSREVHEELRDIAYRLLEQARPHLLRYYRAQPVKSSIAMDGRTFVLHSELSLFFGNRAARATSQAAFRAFAG